MICVLCEISKVCPEHTYIIGHGINSIWMLLCCPWWWICHTRVYFAPCTWCIMAHSSPWGWNRGPTIMHCSAHLLVRERCMWPQWHKMDDLLKSASLGCCGGDPDPLNRWRLEPLPSVMQWHRGLEPCCHSYCVTTTYLSSFREVDDPKTQR